jgi:glycosyltransferase involved in cell wall biosynthesis
MRRLSWVSSGNVLVLVENLSVPMDRRVWQECAALRQAGYRVSVICPQGTSVDTAPSEVLNGVDIYRYPLRPANGGPAGYLREYTVAFAQTARLVARLARRRHFAFVHACNPPDFLLFTALPLRLRRTRFIFDHHDLVPELYLSRFQRGCDPVHALTKLLERATLSLADVVISTNESYARVAIDRGGRSPDDVFVVRSAPDLEEFTRVPVRPKLRHGKRHLLAYLGVMGPQDGLDHALRALAELRGRRSDWHATFIGSGDVFGDMIDMCRRLGLTDHVDFTGRIPVPDVVAILSAASVGLAPDPKNPLNDVSTMNKILEYMAVGLPVVSYDLKEARVSAGGAAAYAAPNSPVAFASEIDSLLDDPRRRRKMGQTGRARVAGSLSWAHSEQTLLRAYERATTRRGSTVRTRVMSQRWHR